MSGAAIVAVLHDIIFTVGVYAIVGFPVTPATVTAFLTILGFSLYDTVVVFDKVRENTSSTAAMGRNTYGEMVDRSLNQVLMRSLSTSLVALLPVVSMLVVGSFILGATTLEDFALALLAGLFIGTYSSIFVATPLLAWWKETRAAVQGDRSSGAPARTPRRRRPRWPAPSVRARPTATVRRRRGAAPPRRETAAWPVRPPFRVRRSRPAPASSGAGSASSETAAGTITRWTSGG